MEESANLNLPYIMPSQAQKHVTHNEAVRRLDAVVQLMALRRDLSAPPPAPADGDRYIVAAAASGAWAGEDGQIAAWQDDAWVFIAPREGWLAWIADENALLIHAAGSWIAAGQTIAELQNLALFGLGTTADAANPFAAKINKALWTARTATEGGDGDLRYTLNKEAEGNVLSLLLQTGFSGRAEFGLIGDDDLSLKVSADGAAWNTAFVVDASSGKAAFPRGANVAGGLELTPEAGDPAAPADGRIWYDGLTARAKARIDGRTVSLGDAAVAHVEADAGRYIRATTGASTTTTVQAGAADRMCLYPFVPQQDFTADRLGIYVTVAAVGALAKIVVYSADGRGRPDALVVETGDLSCATPGAKEAAVSLAFHKGRQVWVGVRTSSSATLSCWQPYNSPDIDSAAISLASNKVLLRMAAHGTAAPASWSYVPDEATNTFPPAVWMRVG